VIAAMKATMNIFTRHLLSGATLLQRANESLTWQLERLRVARPRRYPAADEESRLGPKRRVC
jgi:hypothetical protein